MHAHTLSRVQLHLLLFPNATSLSKKILIILHKIINIINLCTNPLEDNQQASSFTISATDLQISKANEISIYRPRVSILCCFVIRTAQKSTP